MTIGTGIAIAGMWGCVAALGVSKMVTGPGFLHGLVVVAALTALAIGVG